MNTRNFDLLSENVLTINEMFNVRGGDGDDDQGSSTTTVGADEDIIL
ncbi:MAG: hypothetical protein U9N86_10475 [Bacteroidota bacterium]|nr:hypothetical protein [Bacteroidota bacterium]